MPDVDTAPTIADYGLVGDCQTAALVSRGGSIDWCCFPRFDSGSAFGRLLDPNAGHFEVAPAARGYQATHRYLEDSLVLETTFDGPAGTVTLLDAMPIPDADSPDTPPRLIRVIDGKSGRVELNIRLAPRFDYGDVRPWVKRHGDHLYSVIGGNDALIVWSEVPLEENPEHELSGRAALDAGARIRLLLTYTPPELIDERCLQGPDPAEIEQLLDGTIRRWRDFAGTLRLGSRDEPRAKRSGIMLKALTHTATGAMVAAPTTSLPEALGGQRNWDYRYAWVRDSSFASRALAELGAEDEADAFRAFIMRSAAGHAEDLQVLYGVGGERRLAVQELPLIGYRGSRPIRVGNDAGDQRQLDCYGELVNLTWRWHRRGHSPDEDDWRFLTSLIERAAEQWPQRDHGIWEWPGDPDHFVHSKVLCWSALDRGIRLAEECGHPAPVERWQRKRDELRDAIEQRGYDSTRGVYVQAFDRPELDAALLLLPTVEYVDWRDERMLRTVAAIREELDAGEGLLFRYVRPDGLGEPEGAFLCCSFWLTECLARQGELASARAVFDRALATANELGLFPEQVDPNSGEARGNFPQALTHLSHISAAVALAEVDAPLRAR